MTVHEQEIILQAIVYPALREARETLQDMEKRLAAAGMSRTAAEEIERLVKRSTDELIEGIKAAVWIC